MSNFEYRELLYEISRKLDANELQRLVYMCTELIARESAGNIRDVLALFEELEKKNHLGIDRLDTLKDILRTMKKKSLLKKVEKFEIRRKAQSVGIISLLKRVTGTLIGAIRLVCNFRTLAGGAVLVGSGLALRSCTSFEEYSDAFEKVIIPAYTKLVELSEKSSLCFTVQAETPSALNELWSIYKNGTLKHRLQEFLVTEEIKQLASGEDIEVTVYVDEQEYREAYLDLMFQQNQASDEKKRPPAQRRRKNSDSFLLLSPKEDEVTLMKLEQAENKWNFKIQVLKREIEKLKTEVAMAEDLQRRVDERGENDLETPQLRRRRHSDTSLYCKQKEVEIEQSEKVQERFLGEEKYSFVQSYLENIHETHSITTLTSDSGIGTHGAPSEIDISDDAPKLCIKHLSERVTSEMERRLDGDKDAKRRVYQAFGISDQSVLRQKFKSIFRLFPNTPVKLLNDVFEALQLYDLLELLEKQTKSRTARSLRPALTFDEIKKLRNSADRNTTYHSCAAVLIFADNENDSDAIGIKTFFTDLDTKSDVTIIQYGDLLKLNTKLETMEIEMKIEEVKIVEIGWRKKKSSEVQSTMQNVKQLKLKIKEMETAALKERENIKTAALTVIERWIQHQGDFSFFVVFDCSCTYTRYRVPSVVDDCFSTLAFRIPDKPKLGVLRHYERRELPETLLVDAPWYTNWSLLLQILKKRWQTLDLISMMAEFKRSVKVTERELLTVTDSLSSLPKFKRKDDLSLSH